MLHPSWVVLKIFIVSINEKAGETDTLISEHKLSLQIAIDILSTYF